MILFLQTTFLNMYSAFKPLLFALAPETAHHATLASLKFLQRLPFSQHLYPQLSLPKTLWGLTFKNPIGLAAGLDKNGDYIQALSMIGFGFIEIGTVTPLAQTGNPEPRLFRIPADEALINRMGFNNLGIDYLIENVKKANFSGILGINIGKNAATPIENALDDYLICLRKAYAYASYITINLSSPNTAGLRSLQHGEFLEAFLAGLKAEQAKLAVQHQKSVPLLVKVAPDLSDAEITSLCDTFLRFEIEGVITTNTTLSRDGVTNKLCALETGGLSGRPLFEKSTKILQRFQRELNGKIPLVAAGGIMEKDHAQAKFAAGADLIQLYTGLVYRGPKLIAECLE